MRRLWTLPSRPGSDDASSTELTTFGVTTVNVSAETESMNETSAENRTVLDTQTPNVVTPKQSTGIVTSTY